MAAPLFRARNIRSASALTATHPIVSRSPFAYAFPNLSFGRTTGHEQSLRHDRDRRRPRWLCRRHPRRTAWPECLRGGTRTSGGHLPQLGLHPDESHAAHIRGVSPHAPRQGIWSEGRRHRLRSGRGGQAVSGDCQATGVGCRTSSEEEQSHRRDGRRNAARQRQSVSKNRPRHRRVNRPKHHPRHRRPRAGTAGA